MNCFHFFASIPETLQRSKWCRWQATACSAAIATGLSNTMRLPREAASHGLLPFLTAYTLLGLVCGIPLVFLKIGLGRFGEQGAIKIWRAVPILKGLGYAKLFASFLLAVCCMIYISLATAFLIWTAKGPIPLTECRELHRGENGYQINGTSGQKCVNETFLKPVFEDPMWYGIITAIMFTLWLLIPLCLIKIPQTFQTSLYILGSGTILLAIGVMLFGESRKFKYMFEKTNWDLMLSMKIWYAAFVQLLFSTHLGFGYLITAAGTIYYKSDVLWSAATFIIFNLIIGWLSVMLWFCKEDSSVNREASFLMILVMIYDSSVFKDVKVIWPTFAYSLLIFSGLSTVLALIYPIIWCIHTEAHCKKSTVGWTVAIAGVFVSLAVFLFGLDVITLLDFDVIPMYTIFFLFIELSGLFLLYGFKLIKQDLEFVVNKHVSYVWFVFWGLIPASLLMLVVWKFSVFINTWTNKQWTFWLLMFFLLVALVNVIIWAAWVTYRKEDYGIMQKLTSAIKPSRKWGPVDALSRHKWLQYKSSLKESNSCQVKVGNMANQIYYKQPHVCRKIDFPTTGYTKKHLKTTDTKLKSGLNKKKKYKGKRETCNGEPQILFCDKDRHNIYQCEVNYYAQSCWMKQYSTSEF